ncbi:transglycosylase SLT domain-containing protein [Acidithiobacillus ferrooxidans]|uniref:transglycosylase SLT domain-containing protein n=1 Tax=Acidithiobacillus ferrooxidans TaxID=920 RepID=UPI002147AB03|nr:transglycosylase SLT domain-containing protein [Acidithiobacillus ferrooxidans]MCR1347507.1 transglycosylase SLT domain-containing protein [Acidithiobacillus ferrooxidans]MCR1355341.1 transglycosylase SLT domain-containing protein [Acidithiobacillus ferrooxidans]MDA8375832.1 transglycosylase SLT domain-containing protein [Planctomycetia bacterium]
MISRLLIMVRRNVLATLPIIGLGFTVLAGAHGSEWLPPAHSAAAVPVADPLRNAVHPVCVCDKNAFTRWARHHHQRKSRVRRLAGPYAGMVLRAARKAHVPARLVAAVVRVENGGDFHGSATRVSSAGAIGVMQLEPATALDTLRVNPWNPRQNIEGGARFLAMLLREFGGNVRLALMAYNAGPTWIAQGGRPEQAVAYAREVLAYAYA